MEKVNNISKMTEEVSRKNKIIDNVIVRLKSEFIGIDDQIDQIMEHVRTWYLYPTLQTSPVVVCLWGLTGIGKTSLLRKIAKYLDIEEDLVYFNFAEINEMTSYDVEQNIEDQLSNEKSNRMFVYDEFQYAATLDSHGEEKDIKNGLKPFWELLDTGIIHKRTEYWGIRCISKVMNYITLICSKCQMNIVDGKWVNAEECLNGYDTWDLLQFSEIFNFHLDKVKKIKDNKIRPNSESGYDENDNGREKFFLKDEVIERVMSLAERCTNGYFDKMSAYHKLVNMNVDEVMLYLDDVSKRASRGYDLKFDDSIIFVVGNLDEAYTMAFDVNPDMSPDQFHRITKKISLVQIKSALQKRFRNEQIARMGNSHIIYPSFSSQNFKDIIMMKLKEYAVSAKELCGYDMDFDKSLLNIIYKESVFPTHGTRPVFSTIQEIVKTKLPNIVQRVVDDGFIEDYEINKLTYSAHGSSAVRIFVDGKDKEGNIKQIAYYDFPIILKLDKLRKSTKDDNQANTALHESGHFVVYAKVFGEMPEKVISRSSSPEAEGFVLHSDNDKAVQSREAFIHNIMVALGGYVAEKKFFGKDKMSSGSTSDLRRATVLASQMVRNCGFGSDCAVTTFVVEQDHEYLVNDDSQDFINTKIRDILETCEHKVEEIFEDADWREMLKQSALYLSTHSELSHKKMMELYSIVSDDKKVCQNDGYYLNAIKNM